MKPTVVFVLVFGLMQQILSQERRPSEADTMKYYYMLSSYDAENQINFSMLTAAAEGNVYILRWLINKGADVDVATNERLTALHYAAGNNRTEAVKTLLEYGADPDVLSLASETPLHIAAKNNFLQVAELLARYGANLNITDRFGATPLHYASAYGFFGLADMLLYYEAANHLKDNDGTTALMAAVWAGHANIADLLLQKGANPSEKDNDGFTPFLIAAQNGDTLVMDLLIRRFVNIYERNAYYYNALSVAAKSNHKEAVKYLLRKGDGWAKDNVSVNPSSVARSYGRMEIVELLVRNGIPEADKKGIRQLSITTGTRLCLYDYLASFSMTAISSTGKSGLTFGYDFKPIHTRVLFKYSDVLYYQYMDKSSLAHAGFFKYFPVTDNVLGGNWNISLAASAGWYFPDKLKGTNLAPGKNFKIIPSAGINWTNDKVTFKADLEYNRTPFYRIGPLWLRFGAGFNIIFNKSRAPGKTIKWY